MSLQYAILGLLSIKPQSGYDIKTNFEQSIRYLWNADQTQIYKTLSDMTKNQYVSSTTIIQDGKPSKKVYEITDLGMDALIKWISKPQKPKNQRNQELLQFFFSGHLSDDEILKTFKKMQQGFEMNIEALVSVEKASEIFNPSDKPSRIHYFFRKTLELGIQDAYMNYEWITKIIHEIEEGVLDEKE